MRVLLVSPVRSLDPPNGDVTYTEQLLAHPPPDVTYTPYDEALAQRTLQELYRRRTGAGAPHSGGGLAAFAREAATNRARASGLLFREPFRFFRLEEGAFDLVHVHVFSTRFEGSGVRVVVSNSIDIDAVYRDGFGLPAARVARMRRADAWLADRRGVMHSSYGHRGAAAVVCFSEHLRDRYLARDDQAAGPYLVVPPGVAVGAEQPAASAHFHVGFIGDWDAKGGDTVLAAHRLLRTQGHDVRLTVVGSDARLAAEESERLGVAWLPRLPRRRLIEEVIPSFSVFAYPSRFDGLPFTLLEVMAAGVPVVVSDYGALPEVVSHDAGLVVPRNDPDALAAALLRAQDERRALSDRARARVLDRYEVSRTSAALGAAYRLAIGADSTASA
jgi:glycosyltransferase involved in cell wall biosynthesis